MGDAILEQQIMSIVRELNIEQKRTILAMVRRLAEEVDEPRQSSPNQSDTNKEIRQSVNASDSE